MTTAKYIALVLFSTFLFAQGGSILPGQKSAIQSLSTAAGFTSADLNTYLVQNSLQFSLTQLGSFELLHLKIL